MQDDAKCNMFPEIEWLLCILQAQPVHLKSSFEFMRTFHAAGDWNGMTGFQACPSIHISRQTLKFAAFAIANRYHSLITLLSFSLQNEPLSDRGIQRNV